MNRYVIVASCLVLLMIVGCTRDDAIVPKPSASQLPLVSVGAIRYSQNRNIGADAATAMPTFSVTPSSIETTHGIRVDGQFEPTASDITLPPFVIVELHQNNKQIASASGNVDSARNGGHFEVSINFRLFASTDTEIQIKEAGNRLIARGTVKLARTRE